jgi:hypothetical protein
LPILFLQVRDALKRRFQQRLQLRNPRVPGGEFRHE